jgi:Ca-activated chloride channel homolog
MPKGDFGFLYPWALLLLFLVPLLGFWFLLEQRQYWRDAMSFSKVDLLKKLKHLKNMANRQRILPLLLLLALLFSIIGLAQPVFRTRVVTQNSNLMLILDISISMEATDISPNRLDAAKTAAIDFTRHLPDETLVGLELFAGNSYLVTPPIEDHEKVIGYLESLQLSDLHEGTAIGDALINALDALRASVNHDLPLRKNQGNQPLQQQGSIILLTDGENNLGISPTVAVSEAIKQHVPVFTVGMGEETGAYVRGGIFTHLDESELQTIAQQTGGDFYRARSFQDFKWIYDKISQKTLGTEEKQLNLMPWCLALSTLLLLSAFIWGVRNRRF